MKTKTVLLLVLLVLIALMVAGCRVPCDTDVQICLWV